MSATTGGSTDLYAYSSLLFGSAADAPTGRCETMRKQHIESEPRRRDKLKGGYAHLKEARSMLNQKSSKVSLLDRGTFILILFYYLLLMIYPYSYQSTLISRDHQGSA